MTTTRDLSGITPSGSLTLGNHLGALRRFVERQAHVDGYYFVADLHALTTRHDPERHKQLTLAMAATFFGAGLDPTNATVFVQSHVPEHVQLAYLLECTAYVGELSRMIQFKDKGGQPGTRASLFTYPCLMAADILLYGADRVPVGGDQSQHVELTRDLAARFNDTYGDTFVIPELEPATLATRVLDLQNPALKMSKSAPQEAAGVVRMLDAADAVARKVRRAVTDSDGQVRYDPTNKPGVSNLIDILATLTGEAPDEIEQRVATYGQLKSEVADAVIAELEPIQRRHDELLADPGELHRLLRMGAQKAHSVAGPTIARAAAAMGVEPS